MKFNLFLTSISLVMLLPMIGRTQAYEIYVSDAGNFDKPPWQILKVTEDGQKVEVFTTENLAWPQDILFLEDQGVVLISNLTTGRISRHDIETGDFIDFFAANISGPNRMKIGPDSLLYVLQWSGNGLVLRYDLKGKFIDRFTDVSVSSAIGIDWDQDGNLYVSSYDKGYVSKFDQQGNHLGFLINTNLIGPTNLWFDKNGDLLVHDYKARSVKRFGPDGQYKGIFMSGLLNPEGIDQFPNGNFLIGNVGTSAVKLFDADGKFIRDYFPAKSQSLIAPNAVRIRSVGTSSTTKQVKESQLIKPNVGKSFYFDSDAHEFSQMEVFNILGRRVDQTEIKGELAWEAGHVPDGPYILKATTSKDVSYVQQVIVKK